MTSFPSSSWLISPDGAGAPEPTGREVYPESVSTWKAAHVAGALPGEDLVNRGVADLERKRESIEALLVSIGAPRLTLLGLNFTEPIASPEHRLYELLAAEDSDAAHSRYNALVRRLVSFERAAECVS
jgi:hypothetical protein